VQGDDVTRGCFLHVAVGRLGVETLDESLGKLNRLQFRAPRLLGLATGAKAVQPLGQAQGRKGVCSELPQLWL